MSYLLKSRLGPSWFWREQDGPSAIGWVPYDRIGLAERFESVAEVAAAASRLGIGLYTVVHEDSPYVAVNKPPPAPTAEELRRESYARAGQASDAKRGKDTGWILKQRILIPKDVCSSLGCHALEAFVIQQAYIQCRRVVKREKRVCGACKCKLCGNKETGF